MTFEPTPKQALLLWDVLARGGSAPQADLPSKVAPKDREALARAGLLSARKVERSLWLTVEDGGWAWANDHLDASLAVPAAPGKARKGSAKPPAPTKTPTLQLLLTHLRDFLRARDFALSDFLPQVAPPEDPPKKERRTRAPKASGSGTGKKPPLASIEKKIRAAVAKLEGSPQRDGVRLSALREALPDIGTAHLDDALVRLFEAGKITLMNLDNPRDIERERAAAIDYKGRLLQVVWIK